MADLRSDPLCLVSWRKRKSRSVARKNQSMVESFCSPVSRSESWRLLMFHVAMRAS